jgi:hypothetical protein
MASQAIVLPERHRDVRKPILILQCVTVRQPHTYMNASLSVED